MATEKNYYEILGVPVSAGPAEIRAVYRRLAFEYHPDRNSSIDAQQIFQKIIEAYSVLSDPEKRREYDATLFDLQPLIASSLSGNILGADELYNQTASRVNQGQVINPGRDYLEHLRKSRRRRTVIQTIITIIVIFLLIFFGFKPLNDSSKSIAPTTNSQSGGSNSTTNGSSGGSQQNTNSSLNQNLIVIQGPAGPQGLAGPAGRDGRIGVDGIPGPAGARGADGAPGKDGAAGPAGRAGPAGAAGPAGPAGAPGVAGAAGAQGAQGPAGAAGTAGAQGAQGPAGRDGTDATVYTVRPNIGAVSGGIYPCNQNLSDTATAPNLNVTMSTRFDATTEKYMLSAINISGFTSACYGVSVGVNIIMSSTASPANAVFQCIRTLPNPFTAPYGFSFVTGLSEGCTKYSGWGGSNGSNLDIADIDASELRKISLIVSG